jgi:hypothetical protein
MRNMLLAATLLSIAFGLSVAQKKTAKQIQVTNETIASRGSEKPYVIDLGRGGAVYHLAVDLDLDRVKVRTSKGPLSITELTKRLNKSERVVIGTGEDLRFDNLNAGAARNANYSCGVLTCECTGPADCVNLDRSGKCKGPWACDKSGCACYQR